MHKVQEKILKEKNSTIVYPANETPLKINQTTYDSDINPHGIFDIIVCDEAHRTTGIKIRGSIDDSSFIKVHDNEFLPSKRRLYMTATPRIYTDEAKKKAAQGYAELCSMDDSSKYGDEIYHIGFSEAVEKGLLSDYKVLVLTIGEDQIPASIQNAIASQSTEISTDSASKLIGCINALSKRMTLDSIDLKEIDPGFMHTALAFCSNIKISQAIKNIFNEYAEEYYDSLTNEERSKTVKIQAQHVDGSMNASVREEKLQWLKKTNTSGKDCHILTNVRCLSEGVDVPSLDAIIFLSSRNSQVDVVQSVGRVMRRPPANSGYNKKYGYIIIPVVIPPNVEPDAALSQSKDFSTVWSVLNALRAHDDRFDAKINKIDLNKNHNDQILVGGTPNADGSAYDGSPDSDERVREGKANYAHIQTTLYFSELQRAIYARMVKKVGTKRYWEDWAKNVAEIARRHKERIQKLINTDDKYKLAFQKFLIGLHKNINPYIEEEDAINMLSQHLITQPVFEALFEDYSFVKNNPISKSMNDILELLDKQALEKDRETLQEFYKTVKRGCEGIDNAEGKQEFLNRMYNSFFKLALPDTAKKLGIVYTPVEVVDFILRSVNDILKKEFRRSLSDENIHILDPFTGTGTFITRLLHLNLIKPEDLMRKYSKELHANEIVLLAYYIASINIENTFHEIAHQKEYKPFDGICLTDTFQLNESIIKNEKGTTGDGFTDIYSDIFPANSQRVIEQKKTPIQIIIGNPPYSKGRKAANDNTQNESYPKLEQRLAETYVKFCKVTNKNALYDAYIKSFRWASDRINEQKQGGIIGFVSNAGWLDAAAMDGFRQCLEQEFSSIYVFNLRGNALTSGELRRKEKDNIFAEGTRTSIAITILVKNPKQKKEKADIFYHDIGDYLSRDDKLKIIADFKSCMNSKFPVTVIKPNKNNDWINQRNETFSSFVPIGDKKNKTNQTIFFPFYSRGIATSRDSWCYNYSRKNLISNIEYSIEFYNNELDRFNKNPKSFTFLIDSRKFSWNGKSRQNLSSNIRYEYNPKQIATSIYRPYCKEHFYYDKYLNEGIYQMPKLFPTPKHKNILICVSGIGGNKAFSLLITDFIPCLDMIEKSQCFPLYYYEKQEIVNQSLFDDTQEKYVRHDAITDFILNQAKGLYGDRVEKEDIFYYVYGFLHLPKYRQEFAADLKKSLPRIMLVDEPKVFWQISKAGRDLADIHLNYEDQGIPDGVIIDGDSGDYTIIKMKFPKKDQHDTIIYNKDITISNIPKGVYDYTVNGRSPVEWVMERYQIKIDKASGIENNPNDWAIEHNQPRYILDLLLSVMNVSLKTQAIVNSLPDVMFE